MITLGDIFRRYGPAYRAQYAERLLPSHRAALAAIEAVSHRGAGRPRLHLSGLRHHALQLPLVQQSPLSDLPAGCGPDLAGSASRSLLLPVPYFLVTFTLPPALRELARTHQRQLYTLLFRASAAALQQLAHDPRFLGGQIGMLGVLQTWTRDLRYHPHVHYLVPALGWHPMGQSASTAQSGLSGAGQATGDTVSGQAACGAAADRSVRTAGARELAPGAGWSIVVRSGAERQR